MSESPLYILDINLLRPGDIVLTAQDALVSKGIRRLTGGEFSHAILIVAEGSYIHSDGDGVHSNNLERLLFKKEAHACCLRLRDAAKSSVIQAICDHARTQVGKQYSRTEAAASIRKSKRAGGVDLRSNRQFCSRLVAQSYAQAGIPLVPTADYCFPSELHHPQLMVELKNVVREATAEEILFAQSPSPLAIQAKVTNRIYAQARAVCGKDIQNEQQLITILMEQSDLDAPFSEILEQSGFLTLWKMELSANSWRYDERAFRAITLSSQDRANEAVSADREIQRYQHNLNAVRMLAAQKQLKYFQLLIILFETMIELHSKRKRLMEGRI